MSANSPVAAALPESVRIDTGRGGLPRLNVVAPSGNAEVYLQGAHVTAWAPAGADPVLWVSQKSAFAPGSPIRGGVPVCFPWFGPPPSGTAPLHGFARTSEWTLTDAAEQGDDVILDFVLVDTEATRASVWPHLFRARYTVSVGASLRLAFEVRNTGGEGFTADQAFHTYLGVGDVRGARITGLESATYIDRLSSPEVRHPDGEALAITAETDRVYAQAGTIRLVDPAIGRYVQVTAAGSANTVVWNPWKAKAVAMADFGDDEWQHMVCVETCNVIDGSVTLAPGESHTMTATIKVVPLG